MLYQLFQQCLASDIELPELAVAQPASPDTHFSIADPSVAVTDIEWDHVWEDDDGEIELKAGTTTKGETVVCFPCHDDATFLIDHTHSVIKLIQGECPLVTVRHLLLDQVLPRMIGQGADPVVHGAGVVTSAGQGILLIGESGAGKSTLARAMSMKGASSLSDDCLLILSQDGQFSAMGSYAGDRLRPESQAHFGLVSGAESNFDSAASKHRFFDVEAAVDPVRIRRIVLLAPGDEPVTPTLNPMQGVAAAMALQEQRFLLDPSDPEITTRHLKTMSGLASSVEFMTLEYQHNFDQLDQVAELLLALC